MPSPVGIGRQPARGPSVLPSSALTGMTSPRAAPMARLVMIPPAGGQSIRMQSYSDANGASFAASRRGSNPCRASPASAYSICSPPGITSRFGRTSVRTGSRCRSSSVSARKSISPWSWRSSSRYPRSFWRFPCRSRSTARTRHSLLAKMPAAFAVMLVLPTPPLPFTNAIELCSTLVASLRESPEPPLGVSVDVP